MTRSRSFVAIILAISVSCSIALAGTIRLKWDPVPGDLAGYKLYYGYQSGVYVHSLDVENVTSYVLTDLQDCTMHYLAVTAYDSYGYESDYSNEVSGWPKPEIQTLSPLSARQGESLSVIFSGINFDEGARPEFMTPDITVLDYFRNNCSEIVADITLKGISDEKPAQIGFYPVSIVNSDGVQGSSPADFEITLNEKNLDTDGNKKVDGIDLANLGRHFGAQQGDAYYDPSVDFNGDGWIDGIDLSILSAHFGETLP